MFVPLVAGLALSVLSQDDGPGVAARMFDLPRPDGSAFAIRMIESFETVRPPKIAPKYPDWEFEWSASGFGQVSEGEPYRIRTVVYSQKPRHDDRLAVARMLMRLWELNMNRHGRDNPGGRYQNLVTVYLAFGGRPGGEHMFSNDPQMERITGREVHVNTIYIYDIDSFTEPIQKAREVAHEFGHATLWGTNGYTEREDWANGYLGEKMFLRWLRDEIRAERLTSEDAMGASLEALDRWVVGRVDPLVQRIAERGPNRNLLESRNAEGMDEFLGLALYLEQILPPRVFRHVMDSITGFRSETLLPGIQERLPAHPSVRLTFPESWKGQEVWVPVARGTLSVRALETRNGWARVRLDESELILTHPEDF